MTLICCYSPFLFSLFYNTILCYTCYTYMQSVKQMKLDVEGVQLIEKLEIVECDLEKQDQIGQALGNASMVLCCIGASEKEVFDITGPYRIDYQATKNLIDAATVAKVKHFIMVSSLGTNKLGFPAAILNLFWGVLIWKRKAEEALIASGLPYTIVRPGGMERPTDAYKETHNITLSEEDTLFGGQVSNLQVAELMAFMAKNRELSYCKVVEVIAETTAPLTPMDKLLTKIPSQRIKPKRSYVADNSGPAPSKTVMSEASSLSAEKKPAQVMAAVTKPLSPYTAYDDLKPPTSPMPTAPSGQKATANPSAAMSPNIPGTRTSSSETGPVEAKIARPLSPYVAYDDLKPPTSPSPAAPVGSLQSSSSILNGEKRGNSAPPTSAAWNKPHQLKPNLRPLSPYTMYEDLKPPASPAPSPKKLN
uniref:Protein TIC 62ic isoform X1 n=1 Tax=Rhizophora mucronata TaxID=61149 RepID=A0A2P2K8W1_RHIMU